MCRCCTDPDTRSSLARVIRRGRSIGDLARLGPISCRGRAALSRATRCSAGKGVAARVRCAGSVRCRAIWRRSRSNTGCVRSLRSVRRRRRCVCSLPPADGTDYIGIVELRGHGTVRRDPAAFGAATRTSILSTSMSPTRAASRERFRRRHDEARRDPRRMRRCRRRCRADRRVAGGDHRTSSAAPSSIHRCCGRTKYPASPSPSSPSSAAPSPIAASSTSSSAPSSICCQTRFRHACYAFVDWLVIGIAAIMLQGIARRAHGALGRDRRRSWKCAAPGWRCRSASAWWCWRSMR